MNVVSEVERLAALAVELPDGALGGDDAGDAVGDHAVGDHAGGDHAVGDRFAGHVEVTGPARVAASAFEVDRLLASSAAFAVAAADRYGEARGVSVPDRVIDLEHLVAFCTTHVEVDGSPVPAWADLSGVYPTADGRHLQIHCNFPHHADGVVRRLGCAPDRDAVAAAILQQPALALEEILVADGMIAAAVRTIAEWDAHPHAAATRDLPVISVERIGDAPPPAPTDPGPADARQSASSAGRAASHGSKVRAPRRLSSTTVTRDVDEPLAGVRVLDCSRVLAGPVAGQLLAAFGAEVLRVGADHLPSVPVGVMSTGFGKRNTSVDLRTEHGTRQLEDLVRGADVWIDAFRPGALAGHGFTPERLAELRPGIVMVEISAFDWTGPWAGRRGFDSIVQSTTGVRWAGGQFGAGADTPLGLPVQALDYATGFLAAGVVGRLLAHRRDVGGSWRARVSLLRTQQWLRSFGGPKPYVPAAAQAPERFLDRVDSDFGRLTVVRPFAGTAKHAPQRLGTAPAAWSTG